MAWGSVISSGMVQKEPIGSMPFVEMWHISCWELELEMLAEWVMNHSMVVLGCVIQTLLDLVIRNPAKERPQRLNFWVKLLQAVWHQL